jgi:hypothetical protein
MVSDKTDYIEGWLDGLEPESPLLAPQVLPKQRQLKLDEENGSIETLMQSKSYAEDDDAEGDRKEEKGPDNEDEDDGSDEYLDQNTPRYSETSPSEERMVSAICNSLD